MSEWPQEMDYEGLQAGIGDSAQASCSVTSGVVFAVQGRFNGKETGSANMHLVTSEFTDVEDGEPQVGGAALLLDKETYDDDLAVGLDEVTRERLAKVAPENTRKAYEIADQTFIDWCSSHGLESLPATGSTLTRYVSHLITLGRAPATISQHMGAIRTRHRKAGYRSQPENGDASELLRWHRRELAAAGHGQKQATPVTPDALRRMVATLDVATVTGRRDRLALVLGFTGMLRRSELVGLRASDVTVTRDGVTLLVRTSKTDKESEGRLVPIPPQTDVTVEPVTLTSSWLTQLRCGDGPLLPSVTRRDQITSSRWWPGGVTALVKRTARDADLPSWDCYSAHSLRAGGLTASLRNGTPLGVAARHGGWNPESPVPSRYARVADQWKDNAMKGVL